MSWALVLYLIATYWLLRIVVVRLRVLANRWTAFPESYRDTAPSPTSVTVCIPARNEALVIASCIHDVLNQDFPGLRQVILVDDCSDDATSLRAKEAAAGDPRLQVVQGEGPPTGWMGKSAACWRAQKEAHGEWLLFVDADVRLHPRALSVALGAAQAEGADMISWLGQLTTESFWEHVVMPFIGDFIALSAPLKKVNDSSCDDCLANGQFILIRRSTYDAVGGHEAIRSSVVDDVSLSRSVKHHEGGGLRYILLHSLGLMNVRMYESLPEIWAGFSKNFYAAAQERGGWMLTGMIFILITSVLPFIALPGLWWTGGPVAAGPAALAIAAILGFRLSTLRFIPAPGWSLLAHPIAAGITVCIMANSMLIGLGLKGPARWKGRPVS
jgi:glycosyltransferase involved in cell wall biosynthesis